MSTSDTGESGESRDDDDTLEELINEYSDVVSELAGRDSPFAERLRQLRKRRKK